MIEFLLNGTPAGTDAPEGSVVLDLLRRERGLTGTKEGCREGDCGACTVLLGTLEEECVRYRAVNSCLLPVAELRGRHLVTIEGLNGPDLSPVQRAIVEEGATQCGFCTPGIVVALTGFLLAAETVSVEAAWAAIAGNICRCTGYMSIRRAVERLLETVGRDWPPEEHRVSVLVQAGILPRAFLQAPALLADLAENAPSDHVVGVPVAGGTDLYVQRADELRHARLRRLSLEPNLRRLEREDGDLLIGAAVTIDELARSPMVSSCLPDLSRFLPLVASLPIRHRATVGGNLVNASPIGDLSIALLALGASLKLRGPDGERERALEDFFRGYKQLDLAAEERVETVRVPIPGPGVLFHMEKVSRRDFLDIASVNTALLAEVRDGVIARARLTAGGVGPVPLLLRQASAWLAGRPATLDTLREVATVVDAEIAPISDVRGSADYKRRLLRRLLLAHFNACFPGECWQEALP